MSLRSLAFAAAAALALTTAFVPAVEARPPGPPHGGPGWHRPPPPPLHAPRRHHHHFGWLWAPAIAGATIWGLSSLYDDPYDDYFSYRFRYPYTPYAAPSYVTGYSAALSAERSALRAEAAANAAQAAAAHPRPSTGAKPKKDFIRRSAPARPVGRRSSRLNLMMLAPPTAAQSV